MGKYGSMEIQITSMKKLGKRSCLTKINFIHNQCAKIRKHNCNMYHNNCLHDNSRHRILKVVPTFIQGARKVLCTRWMLEWYNLQVGLFHLPDDMNIMPGYHCFTMNAKSLPWHYQKVVQQVCTRIDRMNGHVGKKKIQQRE